MNSTSIAYLGPQGSYSHRATTLLFDDCDQFEACDRFEIIFKLLNQDECEFGVLPIENNTAGIVNESIDLLISSDLKICAEYTMPVQHALLTSHNKNYESLKTLYSMTQPYFQSKNFIDENLSHCHWIQSTSSSQAMKSCLDNPDSAAIGFADTGLKMGLSVLKDNIQNRIDNATRFFVLSKGKSYPQKRESSPLIRSTLVFTLEDQPGSLLSVLQVFKDASINMCHIESRRTPLPEWNYYFFITLETDQGSSSLDKALQKVAQMTPWNRFLGQYSVLR